MFMATEKAYIKCPIEASHNSTRSNSYCMVVSAIWQIKSLCDVKVLGYLGEPE